MKKKLNKAIALGMSAAMAAMLLAGCGGGSSSSVAASSSEASSTASEAASSEAAGSYTDYSAGFPENVTIKIPVYEIGRASCRERV